MPRPRRVDHHRRYDDDYQKPLVVYGSSAPPQSGVTLPIKMVSISDSSLSGSPVLFSAFTTYTSGVVNVPSHYLIYYITGNTGNFFILWNNTGGTIDFSWALTSGWKYMFSSGPIGVNVYVYGGFYDVNNYYGVYYSVNTSATYSGHQEILYIENGSNPIWYF